MSTKALWVLLDEEFRLLNHKSWLDDLRGDLSLDLEHNLQALLKDANIALSQIKGVFCASGPGAYTGLRVSSAFCLGLSLSLKIPLKGVPSIAFNRHQYFLIPIRHVLAARIDRESLFLDHSLNFEFLKVMGPNAAELSTPSPTDPIWGLRDSFPEWPTPEAFSEGIKFVQNNQEPFEIFYGLGPKVFGQYLKD